MKRAPLHLAVLATIVAAGCTAGPDYVQPTAPMSPTFKESPPEQGDWKVAQPSDALPRGCWWTLFGDPQLDALEEQVAPANQDLKVAEARFRQARAMIAFAHAAQLPTISAGLGISSVHQSDHKPFTITTYPSTGEFLVGLDLSYELDLWGRIRRAVAAAREEAQASSADLETVQLSLQAELAINYFQLRAADAQQQILNDTLEAYTEALRLADNRYEGGAAPKADVAQAQTQLETTRVQATDVGVRRAQYEHAIAILIGQPPAAFGLAPAPMDMEPPVIPVGLPSQLLERRPDIAAAERRVAAANEQIGIAEAAYFPTVQLGASVGLEGNALSNWLEWPSLLWAIGPSLSQTLFDGGRRRAASDAAIANHDASVAAYRQTTLLAFQQVEDNLAALRILEQESQEQERAVAAATESLRLATNRYEGGVDTYLQVITAQTFVLSNELNVVNIRLRRLSASALLIKALGGGWDVAEMPDL